MRRNSYARSLMIGGMFAAMVPFSALAQTAPTTAPIDPTQQLLAMLPDSLGKQLSSNLSQIDSARTTGDPAQVANATQIFEQNLGVALSNAEANLQNDQALAPNTTTANLPQTIAGDQQLVSDLMALGQAVSTEMPAVQ